MLPCAQDAALALSQAIDRLEEAYADDRVAPFDRARIRDKAIAANRRFKEQLARPVSAQVQPWTPWNARASIIAHKPGVAL